MEQLIGVATPLNVAFKFGKVACLVNDHGCRHSMKPDASLRHKVSLDT